MRPTLGLLLVLDPLTPQRWWLERLSFVIPGSTATRWLLVADTACLIALGLSFARRWLAIPLALGAGFLVLNVLGLALTEFYLGLALFHIVVGIGTAVLARRTRWLGVTLIVVALAVGALT